MYRPAQVAAVILLASLIGTACKSRSKQSQTKDIYSGTNAVVTAQEKQAKLWAKITEKAYAAGKFPSLRAPRPTDAIALRHPEMAYSDDDEISDGRKKVIHTFGAVAKIEFIADSNSSHPYTGLFKSGAHFGLARLSLAVRPISPVINYTPGMALKFLIDGQQNPSLNMVAMNSLDGQTDSYNFFAHPFSNVLPSPAGIAQKEGEKIFHCALMEMHKNSDPKNQPVDHLATMDEQGNKEDVKAQRYPARLWFVPTPEASKYFAKATAQDDHRELLGHIDPATVLYQVYGDEFAEGKTQSSDSVHLGVIRTASYFVASEYSDQTLHFQHHTKPADPSSDAGNNYCPK
jgi:hypothetical protein